MFTWICPKCGKDVPPAYSECPNCAGSAEPAAAPAKQEPSAPVPPPVAPVSPVVPPPVFAAQPAVPVAVQQPGRVSLPGWMLSLLVAAALIILGLTVVLVRESGRAVPAQSAAAPADKVASPSAALQSDPVFRNLELTGLRLTEDARHKPLVQFVLVNHSEADLGTVSAKVNLSGAKGSSQEPVGTFAFKASLGPYESKDIKAPLDTKLRVYEMPDWQYLRTEIVH